MGTSVPDEIYTQNDIRTRLSLGAKGGRFFEHAHIQTRHLVLPPTAARPIVESTGELLGKFRKHSLLLSREAIDRALAPLGLVPAEIDYLCVVTSCGFVVPSLSALLAKELGFRRDCQRLDVVGMGCNAGVNALAAVSHWCAANPGKRALMVCCEICSAIYSVDGSESSALVNSLFGDGVAAVVFGQTTEPGKQRVAVIDFESHFIPEHFEALRFDWDAEGHRFRFHVGKETPRALGQEIGAPVGRLLQRHSLERAQIKHWVVHSGGAAILDEIERRLELAPDALRHTRSVLRDYGNVSSGSFLFSYERLLAEGVMRAGDYGMVVAMGPGLSIELALVRA